MRTSSLRLGQRSHFSHLRSADDPRQVHVLRRACRGVVSNLENLEGRQLLSGVVEWLMNEGPGSTILNDTAPDGVPQTGELIDGPTWVADRNGTAGRAISLDGVNDYINGSDDFGPWVGSTTTVSFWLKTTARGSDNPRATASVIGTGASSVPEQDIFFGFLDASGRIGLHVPGTLPTGVANAKDTVKSTQRVNDGVWHHIAMTRDTITGDIKLYVDGFVNDSGVANADVR